MQRTPLVCQHLENISRAALEQYEDIVRQFVRNRQGVYALYRRGKLYYVGLASNLRTRLGHHLKDRHADSWDRFSVYLTIGDSHLRELESLILRIVKTPGNKQKGKFLKSEDLRRHFGRAIRAQMRSQFSEMLGGRRLIQQAKRKLLNVESSGRRPVLAGYVTQPRKLRARYKGKTLYARLRRDGMILFASKKFSSPSTAAAVARHTPTCNGWTFWQYERAPGDWVLLDELRK
jgi:hypothetical protein